MKKLQTIALLCAAAMMTSACGEGVAGDYQSREKLSNNKRNKLELAEDGGGELKMYTRLSKDGDLRKITFSVDWGVDGETSDGTEYALKMKCKKGCVEGLRLKFSMSCVLDDLGLLDCDAKKPFNDYGFFEFEPIRAE